MTIPAPDRTVTVAAAPVAAFVAFVVVPWPPAVTPATEVAIAGLEPLAVE